LNTTLILWYSRRLRLPPFSHHQAFRQRLDAHGVSLAYTGESESRRYYRVMKTLDMTDETERKRVLDMVGDQVFKRLAMRVTVDKTPDEGSITAGFIEELKDW
jgi:hypothetical protein